MSSGGLVGVFTNMILGGLLVSAIGFVVERLVIVINTFSNLPADMYTGINMIVLIFKVLPWLAMLLVGLNYVVTCNSESTGEV